jgi:hypothetical protein
MNLKLEDLIAQAMALSPEDRRYLAQLLGPAHEVRDGASSHEASYSNQTLPEELPGMTSVTVVLPDDLAKQAQAAGLLAEGSLADLIRRALREQSSESTIARAAHQGRRLVRENGRLVVEALPDEPPVTDAQVVDALNRMEW